MFAGERFADFAVFYRMLHRSRLPHDDADPKSCLLEQWYQRTIEQGGRVREKLREGVETAMAMLANGMLRHGVNPTDPEEFARPRYWVPRQAVSDRLRDRWSKRWLIGFRDVTNSVVERTAVFSLLPLAGVNHKLPLVLVDHPTPALHSAVFLANANSIVFDYLARQKLGGTSLSYFILKQLPIVPSGNIRGSDLSFIVPRVLELCATAWDLQAFADDAWREADDKLRSEIGSQWEGNRLSTGGHTTDAPEGYEAGAFGRHPFMWDDERRAVLRSELDAYFARLYGLSENDLRFILDPSDLYGPDFPGETFRVLKDKEISRYGEYRIRRLVLEAWNRLAGQGAANA